ncbi:MAG: Flp pilus assembly protein CpaB [Polyangiales bacterium]
MQGPDFTLASGLAIPGLLTYTPPVSKTTFLAALAIAVLGGVLFSIRQKRFVEKVTGGRFVSVLRIVQDIPIGERVFHTSLQVERRPSAFVEDRMIRNEDALRIIGTTVTHPITVGATLTWDDINMARADNRAEVSLSHSIQPGFRAANIEMQSDSFNGLLAPGDRVDIFFTAVREGVGRPTTVLLAQNVAIISDQSSMEQRANMSRWKRSVTLSSTPFQAAAVKHASQAGAVFFAVRNREDDFLIEQLPYVTGEDLIAGEEREDVIRTRRDPNARLDGIRRIE